MCVFSAASPRTLAWEQRVEDPACRRREVCPRLCHPLAWLLNPRACRILFWNLASAFPGCPAPNLGGQFRAAEGAGPQGARQDVQTDPVRAEKRELKGSRTELQGPPPIPFGFLLFKRQLPTLLLPFLPVPTTWPAEMAENGRNKCFNTILKSHQLSQTSQRGNSCGA